MLFQIQMIYVLLWNIEIHFTFEIWHVPVLKMDATYQNVSSWLKGSIIAGTEDVIWKEKLFQRQKK